MNTNDTPLDQIPGIVARVSAKAAEWHGKSPSEKLSVLRSVQALLRADGGLKWSQLSAKTHGYSWDDPAQGHLVAEVQLKTSAMLGLQLEALAVSLEAQAATGKPPAPVKVTPRPEAGQVRVQTLPLPGAKNAAAANGMVGELVLEGLEPEQVPPGQDTAEEGRESFAPGPGVVVVLGAGNVESPTEVLDTLFVHDKAVVFKPNAVNQPTCAELLPLLAPLLDAGYLGVVFGGAEQGKALLAQPGLAGATVTGSSRTYNAVMWGSPDGPAAGDAGAAQEPLLRFPFVAELGSVNPHIVVPGGRWTDKELEAQASQLAALRLTNGSHICASPQVLVTSRGWPHRARFLELVRSYLRRHAPERSYYPGARRSYDAQLQRLSELLGRPAAELVAGEPQGPDNYLPPAFAEVPAGSVDGCYSLSCEAFAPVLVEVALDADDAPAFLEQAVELTNRRLWGSLSGTIIIHPEAQKAHPEALERAIDRIEVGALGVNVSGMFVYTYPQLCWGAYGRGHPPRDIQSGRGRIGNVHRYRRVLKGVLRAPFVFPGMTQAALDPAKQRKTYACFSDFAVYQSWPKLLRLAVNAITGL